MQGKCRAGGESAGRPESSWVKRHRVWNKRVLHEKRSCSIMAPGHARAAVRLHAPQLKRYRPNCDSFGPGVINDDI